MAGPVPTAGFELTRRAGADWGELRRQLVAAAEVLARVVDGAGPADRGSHAWGSPDASGFAAMGCAELLLHAGDVAAARGQAWMPPAALATAVRDRLFPWAPVDADPWAALLWATGRGSRARAGAGHRVAVALRPARRVGRHPTHFCMSMHGRA